MQSSPASRHFLPLRSKYSSQHPVLKRPQSMFLPQCERSSFTPIQQPATQWANTGPCIFTTFSTGFFTVTQLQSHNPHCEILRPPEWRCKHTNCDTHPFNTSYYKTLLWGTYSFCNINRCRLSKRLRDVYYGWEGAGVSLHFSVPQILLLHFANGVNQAILTGIFGPKREKVAGGCSRLHNE